MWNAYSPHEHGYPNFNDNNCRYLGTDHNQGAWCYTTDPDVRWEYCNAVTFRGKVRSCIFTLSVARIISFILSVYEQLY